MHSTQSRFFFVLLVVLTASVFAAQNASAQDKIGIYWDTNYSQAHATTSAAFEAVTGYIVISEVMGTGGVLAWECAVDIAGPGVATSWHIEGQAINAQSPPNFAVGLASPLPRGGPVMVASFELLVTEYPVPIELSLEPIYFASVPDRMVYIDAAEPDQLRALEPVNGGPIAATVNGNTGTWCGTDWQHVVYFGPVVIGESLTRTFYVESCGGSRYLNIGLSCFDPTLQLTGISGQVVVADSSHVAIDVTYTPVATVPLDCNLTIGERYSFPIFGYGEEPVSVMTPSPQAVQLQGRVELEWPNRAAEGDRYHVYRQDPQGHEDRLTDAPLVATNTTVRFIDNPDYPGGTVLNYSYGVVREGVELSRSPAVAVTIKSLPQVQTQLLANVPNPFNPQTRIRFSLAHDQPVRVSVFDLTGRLVKVLVNERRSAGENSVAWQGRDDAGRPVASGAYYVRLESDDQVDHQKIMMLK